jgi:hypothetical protein
MAFVTSLTETAGTPFHVSVFDGAGAPVANADVTWTLPSGGTAVADASGNGFTITVPDTGSQSMTAHGPAGAAGSISLSMNPPVLQFTAP